MFVRQKFTGGLLKYMVQVHVWRECEGMASVVRKWCDQCARRATKRTQNFVTENLKDTENAETG